MVWLWDEISVDNIHAKICFRKVAETKESIALDSLRYGLALVLIVIVPMVIVFWFVIHSGSSIWKKRSIYVAYSVAGGAMLVVGVASFIFRMELVGHDLGSSWVLFLIGFFIYAASLKLAAPVRRHLKFKTFAGVPEISNAPTTLLERGPYAAVRHPRYFMVLVGIVGWALMANFATAYLVGIVCIFGMLAVVQLEERELRQRFGADYTNYAKRVPQIVPRWDGLKHFL